MCTLMVAAANPMMDIKEIPLDARI
jgi:hypothetical protein